MEINPQRVRTAEFKTVRKGVDPEEVRLFLGDVADELERAQNQSTAMEARARAAVARLQEMTEQAESGHGGPAEGTITASTDETETISRTLLLAQRTADTTVADAKAEAARIVDAAKDEAAATLDSAREMSAQLLQEARDEARRVGESERREVLGEVESLKARRDFLEGDVDDLERFLVDQRSRLRDAASAIVEVADRVPGGLGEVRRPVLSASDDSGDAGRDDSGAADEPEELVIMTDADEALAGEPHDLAAGNGTGDDPVAATDADDVAWAEDVAETDDAADVDAGDVDAGDADTEALPAVDRDPSDEFRFSFDDERT